jgi:hypothetical protein
MTTEKTINNELYVNARIYFDTDKTELWDAIKDYWEELKGLSTKIEIETDIIELRDENGNVIDK